MMPTAYFIRDDEEGWALVERTTGKIILDEQTEPEDALYPLVALLNQTAQERDEAREERDDALTVLIRERNEAIEIIDTIIQQRDEAIAKGDKAQHGLELTEEAVQLADLAMREGLAECERLRDELAQAENDVLRAALRTLRL